MKKCLLMGLFLSLTAQASTYFMPGLYGNALSGYYNACFPASGTGGAPAPLYTQLLQPPAWSSGFAATNPVTSYHLDSVFAQGWVNSGLTQYTPKSGGSAVLDSSSGALTNQALLGGNARWSMNPTNLQSYITQNSTTGDLAYYNAAVIEYFSARLAMSSAAFLFSSDKKSENSFLNILYPTGTNGLEERAIVNDFVTAAENLFSWSRYLRNLMIPESIGNGNNGNATPLTTTSSSNPIQITQENGFTLGALETFAGLVIINTSNTAATTTSGVYGIQQVVIPSGQASSAQASTLPKSALPTVSPTQKGLLNPLTYPITVNAPLTTPSSRFTYPGLTSFSVNLPNQNTVSFLPVATQVYGITPGGTSLYAVQETADNWANAPVATSGSYFRQVAFQTPNNGLLPTWSYILGVGVMGATSAATTNPLITFQPNISSSGYNQFLPSTTSPSPTYTPVTVDNSSSQISINYPTNFFEDKQPWAVVVTVSPNSQQGANQPPIVAAVTGVVKLNSFDFPLMFAQDPLAQGYSATNPVQGQSSINMVAPNLTTYGVKKERPRWLQNSLLPASMKKSSVSLSNSLGIAFSQRDVWMGISSLYALTLQANLERKNVDKDFASTNYSFAYMFLQALFNGHLYSTTASSLYSVMKNNNELIGEPQTIISTPGVIGNLAYDYVTESADKTGKTLPLYSLPVSPKTPIAITSDTPKAKGIWPINEPRKEPQVSDWLQQGTPLDWLFLRALMVGRALMENTGITAAALPSIQSIMSNPATAISATLSTEIPLYIPQTNTVITIPSSTN